MLPFAFLLLYGCLTGCLGRTMNAAEDAKAEQIGRSVQVSNPRSIQWGMDGFSLAWGPGEVAPKECRALEESFLALYRQESQCAADADCVPFGTCDAVNRVGRIEELREMQRLMVKQGCKVSWASCLVSGFVCKEGRCVRSGRAGGTMVTE
jgi:hypothetical protein